LDDLRSRRLRGQTVDPACPVNWDHPLNRIGSPGNSPGGAELALSLTNWYKVVPNSGWRGSNTWHDLTQGTRNRKNMTLGAPTWRGYGPPGGYGSVQFNGSSSYGQASIDMSGTADMFTFMAWIWLDNTAGIILEDTANYNNATNGFLLAPSGGVNGAEAAISNFPNGYYSVSFAAPSTGAWHHWAVAYDSRAKVIDGVWLDGQKQSLHVDLNTIANAVNFQPTFNFMARNAGSIFQAGKLDDIRILTGVSVTTNQVQQYLEESMKGCPETLNWLGTTSYFFAPQVAVVAPLWPGLNVTQAVKRASLF
jgi:hypothetical protein